MIERPGLNISEGILGHAKFRAKRTDFICSDYRVCEVVFRAEEFPRNALGRLLKRELREPYWE